ncbi:MAG TPA: GNAT family N-acetyltransferase [Quisquiliibacterium sp.]|nr:GNAT family N-acetyltransferase [Quisquiliibacterium sp.]
MQPTLTTQDTRTLPLPRRILDWVALFERLTAADLDSLIAHFTALGEEDRRLRFGVAVEDAFIERYVQGIDLERDVIFGARSAPGQWVGIGHLVLDGKSAELGLSVLPDARGRGLGAAIFRYAVVRAARAGKDRLYMHCLTSNRAIMSMARAAGMSIRSDAGEADAHLVVPPYPEFARMLIGDAEPGR